MNKKATFLGTQIALITLSNWFTLNILIVFIKRRKQLKTCSANRKLSIFKVLLTYVRCLEIMFLSYALLTKIKIKLTLTNKQKYHKFFFFQATGRPKKMN